jgi:hypothetical protein
MQHLKLPLILLILILLPARAPASGVSASFAPVADQTINLGAKIEFSVQITAAGDSESTSFAILPEEIADQMTNQDIVVRPEISQLSLVQGETQAVKFEIQTKTSALSVSGKKFAIQAKDAQGDILASTEVSLTVAPVYIVNVIDGPNGGTDPANPFDFDSQTSTAYFRPQTNGLQFIFHNLSEKPFIIHGQGAIPHQGFDSPSAHGESYQPALILPGAGADLAGSYTIHGIYQPNRSVVVNASQIPAATQ